MPGEVVPGEVAPGEVVEEPFAGELGVALGGRKGAPGVLGVPGGVLVGGAAPAPPGEVPVDDCAQAPAERMRPRATPGMDDLVMRCSFESMDHHPRSGMHTPKRANLPVSSRSADLSGVSRAVQPEAALKPCNRRTACCRPNRENTTCKMSGHARRELPRRHRPARVLGRERRPPLPGYRSEIRTSSRCRRSPAVHRRVRAPRSNDVRPPVDAAAGGVLEHASDTSRTQERIVERLCFLQAVRTYGAVAQDSHFFSPSR